MKVHTEMHKVAVVTLTKDQLEDVVNALAKLTTKMPTTANEHTIAVLEDLRLSLKKAYEVM